MIRTNRILAALAVAVLIATLWLLGWLRRNAIEEIDRGVTSAVALFERYDLLHGPGGDTLVWFTLAQPLVDQAGQSGAIRRLVLTKRTADGDEHPVLPLTWYVDHRPDWQAPFEGWQLERRALAGPGGTPWGYLYLDLDPSALTTINLAIGAVAVSIVLLLGILLARLWSQESSLKRTTIELGERRRELIRLERLALGGQLAAGILHDLRKPVLNIRHALEDVDAALGDFAPAAVGLQDLRRQTSLFFQILQESQIERFVQSDRAGEEYVNIVPILDFSLNLVRYERRGIEVIRREQENLPPLLAHPYRLVQLFSNLILNAYQAMGGQGRLEIEASRIARGIEVRITDSGPGIPAGDLERVFDPFYTTKPEGEGTGLGLSICRMIVEEMGGTIVVESRAGGPTTFRVTLAAEDAA